MSLHHMVATFSEEDAELAPEVMAEMYETLTKACDEVHICPLEEHGGYWEDGHWVEHRWYRILASGWIWSLN